MVGLSVSGAGTSEGRLISRKTVDLVSAVYVPVAILMVCYALFTYEWRSKFMQKKQVRAWVKKQLPRKQEAAIPQHTPSPALFSSDRIGTAPNAYACLHVCLLSPITQTST